MLRLRPIHATDHPDAWAGLLGGLGLLRALDFGDWVEFDAPHGRVALHRAAAAGAAPGTTRLAFEVGDLDEFARRTREAGTEVVLSDAGYGPTAVLRGPDGLEIMADAQKERDLPAGADAAVHVMPVWNTPDVAGAVLTLRNMGAGIRAVGEGWTLLEAKNGGRVAVRAAQTTRLDLSFHHDGDAAALLDRMRSAGLAARPADGASGRALAVSDPDGGADVLIGVGAADGE